jgi:polyhydroxybutyrate depolymerase
MRARDVAAAVAVWGALATIAGAAQVDPSAGCALNELEHGRRLERTIDVAGSERQFILDVPDGVRPRNPVPLMFDFHGFGHSGSGVWKVSRFKEIAAQESFLTVYPTGLPITIRLRGREQTGPGWQMNATGTNRDVAFTRAMLETIERVYCVDRNRIYSTGFSNGAFFSTLLGCTMADRFAAVAPVSGGPLRDPCTPARAVPVLIHHGRRDDLIPLEMAHALRDQWLAANGCVGEPTDGAVAGCDVFSCRRDSVVGYCEGDFAHTWPVEATERIWQFFSARSLSD